MFKKNLLIIDQSFKDYTGHHYNYNKFLYDNLKSFFNISFYVNQTIKNEINSKFNNTLIKIFQKTSYSINFKLILLKKIKKIKILRYLYLFITKYNFVFSLLKKFYNRKLLVSDYYNKISLLVKKKRDTIFFIHSLSENEFLETLICLYKNKNNNNNKYYLVYRRDPEFLKNYFLILNKLIDSNCIYLLTDSSKIKNYLQNKIKKKISLISIPINFKFKKKPINNNKKNKFIISYLGDARLEKGFFSIPSLIKKLNFNKKYKFVIQANNNGYDLNLHNKTVSTLKKIKNVKLLTSPLDDQEYLKILFDTDIIFLPYKSEFYRYRTSSIFYEGIYAEKIVIVTPNTWMSSFYEKNLVLKNLILSTKNNLQEILKYINRNYNLIIKNILSLKKSIIIKNDINSLKLLFQNSKRSLLAKTNTKSISYFIDENTINRRVDGNQFGTTNIIKNIFNNDILLKKNINFNIIFNRNFDASYALFTMNNALRIFNFRNIIFNLCPSIIRFNLNNNELNYSLIVKDENLIFKDLLLLNYHFFEKQLKKTYHLKKIVLVHDSYSKINSKSQFLDNKNNHYVFVSYYEFLRNHFSKARKYLIFPITIDKVIENNNFNKKFNNYNYFFISSGSEIDKINLAIMLKEINRPINLLGEICYKLDKNFLLSNSYNLILKGFVNNLEEYFNIPKNVFLVPRYYGIGIPVKFLQNIKFRSKVILFGDSHSFGLPDNLVKYLIYDKNLNLSLDDFINNLNYEKLYNNISRFIKLNNNKNKNKLLKNAIC